MKIILGILGVLTAIAGTFFVLYNRNNIKKENYDSDQKTGYDTNESISKSANKNEQKETSKLYATNISDRHYEAGEQIKESLSIITEKSVKKDETNQAKLNRIIDDLEDI